MHPDNLTSGWCEHLETHEMPSQPCSTRATHEVYAKRNSAYENTENRWEDGRVAWLYICDHHADRYRRATKNVFAIVGWTTRGR